MEERLARCIPALSPEELELLGQKRVLVCGCGGLGGWLVELMARLGVGHITVVDGDVFQATDLNRQLLANCATLGRGKAQVARERALGICPHLSVRAVEAFLTVENADALCAGHHLVLDGLDTAAHRLLLADACTRLNIPLIHGAIDGWLAQAATVLPGSRLLHALYSGWPEEVQPRSSSLPFTAAFCAAVQAAEAALVLCGREPTLAGKLRMWDLSNGECTDVPFSGDTL